MNGHLESHNKSYNFRSISHSSHKKPYLPLVSLNLDQVIDSRLDDSSVGPKNIIFLQGLFGQLEKDKLKEKKNRERSSKKLP